ncbi:MAG: hypothetical protein NTY30_01380 [Candidatus Berkelbacteria bacterium]|nr:hypothetical protein [Candidatus Berkelbacteria bacterium]
MPKPNPDSMLGKVARKLVALPVEILGIVYDLLVKMDGNPEFCEVIKKCLRGENPWPEVGRVFPPWLKKVGNFSLPAIKVFSVSVFSAAGFWTGSNFKTRFVGYKKSDSPAEKFVISELTEQKTGQEILNAIGADNAVTGLEYIELAIKSGKLKKDKFYIFLVQPQVEGEAVQAVSCGWRSGSSEWFLEAHSLSFVWDAGYQVVSRVS